MSKKIYNLDSGLDIVIKGNSPWKDSIYTYFGDTPSQKGIRRGDLSLVIELDSTDDGRNMQSSEHPSLLYDQDSFYDSKYNVKYFSNQNSLHIKVNQFGLEWIKWAMQLANLRLNQCFIHSSAVEKNGEAIAFPSWGGVGKTTLTSGLVRDRGYNLLGDDLNIISKDGMLYGFPKRLVIYPYHKSTFPGVFSDGSGPSIPAPLTDVLSRVYQYARPLVRKSPHLYRYARKKNPQSSRIAPSEVFNSDNISKSGELSTVVWLERAPHTSDVVINDRKTSQLVSRMYGSSIFEFDNHCRELTNVATGLDIVDAELIGSRWFETLVQSLDDVRTVELQIPAKLSGTEFTDSVYSELYKENII